MRRMRHTKPNSIRTPSHEGADSGNGLGEARGLRRISGTPTANVSTMMFLILIVWFADSCSKPTPAHQQPDQEGPSQSASIRGDDSERCLQAKRELGPNAIVLRCGHFTGGTGLEAVAAVRVPGLKDDRNGIPISELKILREYRSRWESGLNVDGEVTNGAGYLGANFIDDAHPYPYYRVDFTDRGAEWGSRTASQFTLILFSMSRDGRPERGDIGLGIGWNGAVGRFQEIEPNGEEFAPEVKAPRHIRSR